MNNEIKRVGIIGEGKMGTNIFNYLLDFDLELTWITSPDEEPGSLLKPVQKKLQRSLLARKLSSPHKLAIRFLA